MLFCLSNNGVSGILGQSSGRSVLKGCCFLLGFVLSDCELGRNGLILLDRMILQLGGFDLFGLVNFY